jgi:hypothetical protein
MKLEITVSFPFILILMVLSTVYLEANSEVLASAFMVSPLRSTVRMMLSVDSAVVNS